MNEGWIHHLLGNAMTQLKRTAEKAPGQLVGAGRTRNPLLVLWEVGWI